MFDNTHDGRVDLASHVSSFANAVGGDLLFGIEEDQGVPQRIPGLPGINIDDEKLRLENIIRDCIEPRLHGVRIKAIPVQGAGIVIIIRVPKSWNAPHVAKYRKHWRFYSRNSAGKYRLDVSELRTQFELSGTAAERIRNFRLNRLGKIIAGETPLVFPEDTAKVVIHIVPLSASNPVIIFDITSLRNNLNVLQLGGKYRFNLDGFVAQRGGSDSCPLERYQFFRDGSVEAVDCYLLANRQSISGQDFEPSIIKIIRKLLFIQKQIGVEPPFFIMLSLLGVSGYKITVPQNMWVDRAEDIQQIDRDDLVLTEVMVESYDAEPTVFMRPAFDMVWQAAGLPRSMNYNIDGEFEIL